MSLSDINASLRAAGATQRENFILTGLAFILTKADANYKTYGAPAGKGARAGGSKGAWAVSQEWFVVPNSLVGQAQQALGIFRERNLEAHYFDNKKVPSLVSIAVRWWYPKPTDTQLETGRSRYSAAATSYVSKAQGVLAAGLPGLRIGNPLFVIGAALGVLYLLTRKGK